MYQHEHFIDYKSAHIVCIYVFVVGTMGRRNNGSSELWAFGIMTRNRFMYAALVFQSLYYRSLIDNDNYIISVIKHLHCFRS